MGKVNKAKQLSAKKNSKAKALQVRSGGVTKKNNKKNNVQKQRMVSFAANFEKERRQRVNLENMLAGLSVAPVQVKFKRPTMRRRLKKPLGVNNMCNGFQQMTVRTQPANRVANVFAGISMQPAQPQRR